MRPRVLVVDHLSTLWSNLNGGTNGTNCEISVVEDGLEAYMELSQSDFEAVLVREELPGVPGSELASTVLQKRPDLEVILFGDNGSENGTDKDGTRHIEESPQSSSEAGQLLEKAVALK